MLNESSTVALTQCGKPATCSCRVTVIAHLFTTHCMKPITGTKKWILNPVLTLDADSVGGNNVVSNLAVPNIARIPCVCSVSPKWGSCFLDSVLTYSCYRLISPRSHSPTAIYREDVFKKQAVFTVINIFQNILYSICAQIAHYHLNCQCNEILKNIVCKNQ